MSERKETIQSKSQELEEIIKYFEAEEIDLDKAIEQYEKACALVKEIDEVLKKYEARVKKIKAGMSAN